MKCPRMKDGKLPRPVNTLKNRDAETIKMKQKIKQNRDTFK